MPRKITDPYEVLGLDRGATEVDVRAAYLRLAKKHHPDKNPGDKASEWIFKEVQRAYETLRGANDGLTAEQERPPRREQRPPPPSDRAERDARARQRQQRSERTERKEYKPRERQQATSAGNRREPSQSQLGHVWIPATVRRLFEWDLEQKRVAHPWWTPRGLFFWLVWRPFAFAVVYGMWLLGFTLINWVGPDGLLGLGVLVIWVFGVPSICLAVWFVYREP